MKSGEDIGESPGGKKAIFVDVAFPGGEKLGGQVDGRQRQRGSSGALSDRWVHNNDCHHANARQPKLRFGIGQEKSNCL